MIVDVPSSVLNVGGSGPTVNLNNCHSCVRELLVWTPGL